jgi:hypothetical protein
MTEKAKSKPKGEDRDFTLSLSKGLDLVRCTIIVYATYKFLEHYFG